VQFRWKCDNAHGHVSFYGLFLVAIEWVRAQLTILGAQLRKAALHAAGMLVLTQGSTDVLGGLLFNAASTLVLPGCLGLAEQAVPV
jgi:hypothetical protein